MDNLIPVDLGRVAQDLQIRRVQVESVVQLLDEGNTVPFITRYRKERTGNLNEVVIQEIQLRVQRLRELAERKETILKAIEGQGKLNDDLAAAIRSAENSKRLEDLYLPFKPKKRTKASDARERGLEPLALQVWNRDEALTDLPAAAQPYVDAEKGLDTVEKVLEGVGHILAEAISEMAAVRDSVRKAVWKTGKVATTKGDIPEGQGLEFRDYFEYTEPLSQVPPHRVLAINRGDKEGSLKIRLEIPRPELETAFFQQIPLEGHPQADFFHGAAIDALDRLIFPSMEREVRRDLTEAAERHAVDVFARNLRSLLLQPPIPKQVVMAIDPGLRSGCKVAVLDPQGNLLDQIVIYPHAPQHRRSEAKQTLKDLVGKHGVGVVAIGNGTACRETEELIADIIAEGVHFSQGGGPLPVKESTNGTGAEAEKEASEPAAPASTSTGEDAEAPTASEGDIASPAEPVASAEPAAAVETSESPEPAAALDSEETLPPIIGGAPEPGEEGETSASETSPEEHGASEAASNGEPAAPTLEEQAANLAEMRESGSSPHASYELASSPTSEPSDETPATGEEATPPAEDAASPAEGSSAAEAEPAPASEASTEAAAKPAQDQQQQRRGGKQERSRGQRNKGPASPPPPETPPAPHAADKQLAQLAYVIVNEAGASVYSTSQVGRDELPDFDATLRSAISIGRRLQDPLAELVKIEPQNIGVGLYQHDVNPKQLKETLESVIASCVNFVGVDLNTASVPLLRHVSGLNQLTARRIVDRRKDKGAFAAREQLLEVEGVGPATYTQAAGFLKIPEAANPLDKTWVHPESYETATKLLEKFGLSPDVVRSRESLPELQTKLTEAAPADLAKEMNVGEFTLKDIIEALGKPERDPRDDLPKPIFKKGILKIEDLAAGMELKGTVLNVVDFGAFVDIGLKDSGLVHISQLANRYIKSPHDVVSVGDVVSVWVMGVDQERKRVSLTMVKPGTERQRGGGGPGGGRRGPQQGEPRGEGRRDRGRSPRPSGSALTSPPVGAAPVTALPDQPPARRPGGPGPGSRPGDGGGRPGGPGRGGPGRGGPYGHGGGPGRGRPGGGPQDRPQAPRMPTRPSKPSQPPPPLSKEALSGNVPLRSFGQLKQLWASRDATPEEEAAKSSTPPPPQQEPSPAPAEPQQQQQPSPPSEDQPTEGA